MYVDGDGSSTLTAGQGVGGSHFYSDRSDMVGNKCVCRTRVSIRPTVEKIITVKIIGISRNGCGITDENVGLSDGELELWGTAFIHINLCGFRRTTVYAYYNFIGTCFRSKKLVGGFVCDNYIVLIPSIKYIRVRSISKNNRSEKHGASLAQHGILDDNGNLSACGSKRHFLTIRCAFTVDGIRPNVVCGVRLKARQLANERTRTRAVARVCVGDGRIL